MSIEERKKVIEVVNLTIGYERKTILERINFSVYEGEVFVIMGGSGCGKSTLLKNIIGLNRPFSGEVRINEQPINKVCLKKKREIMRSFGITFQGGALLSAFTLGENISLLLEEYTKLGEEERRKIVEQKLTLVGLEDYIDYYPSEISGGMMKRAGLARAMALDPKMLFFDEPSAGLDPISSAELDKLILKLGRQLNVTVVVVSHELDSIFSIADRVVILDSKIKGIAETGKPSEILKRTGNKWIKKFLERDGMTKEQVLNSERL